ncbi:YbgA family protein [Romboutsia sp.]|uniref:YbgA family protein n=1 Tax=Romboutsia sp. TaxID=1965302 RepID=UPI003F3FA3A5
MRKPKIIVSKCLNFEKCRYDGQGYNNKVIESLQKYVDIKAVCPEVEIGLSIPRDPIRIETNKEKEEYRLIQHKSNYDYTEQMNKFTKNFISNIEDVDGFILKSKSPSCGIKDVKVYHQGNKCSVHSNANGFFSKEVLEKYNYLPVENEGRLKNYSIRDNFFTKVFTINRMKECNNIVNFHNENLYLLKSYDKEKTKELNEIILSKNINEENNKKYKDIIYNIIRGNRNKRGKLEIIENIFEKYRNRLNYEEIKMFNSLIESYEQKKIPFSALAIAIRIYALRFSDKEVINQTFFNPYPEELINITDSGQGRDL